MRISINLASRDYRKAKLARVLLVLLALFLLGAAASQIRFYLDFRQERASLAQTYRGVMGSRTELEGELTANGLDITESGISAFSQKIAVMNELLSRRTFSWTLLLRELEGAIARNISVRRLQPEFPEGRIILTGKALSLKDLTRLIIEVENAPGFGEVFLRDQKTDQEGFVEFTIEFKYHPAPQRA